MSQNHVVNTSATQQVASKLNMQSQALLIMKLADASKGELDALSTDLRNQLQTIAQTANEALAKAQVLDDFEKGQLEAAFTQFLATSGMQSMLEAMNLTINGKAYTAKSILEELLDADKIATEEFTYDAQTGLLSAAKYTLQDGYIANMGYTNAVVNDADGNPTNDLKFSGQCGNWRGLVVTESFTFRQIKATVSIFGNPFEMVSDNQLVSRSHIQFDITPFLTEATLITAAAPDLNANGTIGA